MMTIHFLMGANQEQFGELVIKVKYSYLKNNTNDYPKNLHAA